MNTQCNVDGEATLAPAGPYCWADDAEFNDFRRRLAGVIAQIARLGQSGQELAAQ